MSINFQDRRRTSLDLPDATFDACRSERMLHGRGTEAAIDEMIRVVKPGGRISLIDTDWRTFAADVDDLDGHLGAVLDDAGAARRRPPEGASATSPATPASWASSTRPPRTCGPNGIPKRTRPLGSPSLFGQSRPSSSGPA